MTDILLEVIISLPIQVVIAWGFTVVLPMRAKHLYFGANVCIMVFMNAAGELFFDMVAGMLLIAFVSYVLPCILYKGYVAVRILAMAMVNAVDGVALFAANALWALMIGGSIGSGPEGYHAAIRSYPLSFAASETLQVVLLTAAFIMLSRLFSRWSVDRGGVGGLDANVWITGCFLALQVAFMVLAYTAQAIVEFTFAMWVVSGAIMLGCVVSDVLILLAFNAFEEKVLEEQRSLAMQGELEKVLSEYDDLAKEIEETMRIRHDFRNQMQTAMAMAERGDLVRAKQHVKEMMLHVEGQDA